ncbi:hypothetical protein M413DRAFT_13436 [Hebeloma cylindrosporum]|uniref:Uncharacterized protein n=1 Tax=Hebeloma cylindrosporum TaxID=76867 RepID=A0A0C2Y8C5_HEBCY|nr:hypothetical protein M413DRAFT_13436 [Hebeloma cylindrosporum h7]
MVEIVKSTHVRPLKRLAKPTIQVGVTLSSSLPLMTTWSASTFGAITFDEFDTHVDDLPGNRLESSAFIFGILTAFEASILPELRFTNPFFRFSFLMSHRESAEDPFKFGERLRYSVGIHSVRSVLSENAKVDRGGLAQWGGEIDVEHRNIIAELLVFLLLLRVTRAPSSAAVEEFHKLRRLGNNEWSPNSDEFLYHGALQVQWRAYSQGEIQLPSPQ